MLFNFATQWEESRVQTVKQPVSCEKNGKGRSTCHWETIQINVDDKIVTESSPQNGIPTLWDCHYTKSANIYCHKCCSIPGVTPKFVEDSDVEVSEPTLEFSNDHDGCKLLLISHSDIKALCVHRQR